MDLGHHHGGGITGKWKKRPKIHHSYRTPLLLAALTIFALFISSKIFISPSLFSLSRDSQPLLGRRCAISAAPPGEKFHWYAPHSGFSNQLSETLIVPPVLDHHAAALGSCPKFRVLDPNELRFNVWNHSIQLIRDRRLKYA